MASYLIPYLDPRKIGGHDDPRLDEYTYGDSGRIRGGMLLNNVAKGDFLFFHTNMKGKHVITAYFCVERSMLTTEAKKDPLIARKYRNPHLAFDHPGEYDTIVFGNVIYSRALTHPVPLTPDIQGALSRRPKSIARPWVRLGKTDVELLLSKIEASEEEGFLKDTFLSSSEVQQIMEEDIETFIQSNPQVLGATLKPFRRQHVLQSGDRADLILQDHAGLLVVEIKKGAIGREAFQQVSKYARQVRSELGRTTRAAIVCGDVLPTFEEFFDRQIQQGKIDVYLYSWRFNVRRYTETTTTRRVR